MSLSLGEKLRQAREEQGISISEIAEQTRISPHYLESIENNDFKILPGGIFNKGFVKSFARYVGVDEAEALRDYADALGETDGAENDLPRPYHPEVLTDDRSISSMAPTIVFAVIILALMTGGILFLVRYLQNPGPASNQAALTVPANTATNTNSANVNGSLETPPVADRISVELKAVGSEVWVSYAVDGVAKNQTLTSDQALRLDASNTFTLSYSKSKLSNLQVFVNGKQIAAPPPSPKGTIDLVVNKSNVNDLVQNNQAAPPATPEPASTVRPEPSPTPAATEPRRSPEPTKPKTPRPTPAEPKASPTVIVVGNQRPKATPAKTPN